MRRRSVRHISWCFVLVSAGLALPACRSTDTDEAKAAELLRFERNEPEVIAAYERGTPRAEVLERFDGKNFRGRGRFVRTLDPSRRVNTDIEFSWEWVSALLAERQTGQRVARVDTLEDTSGSRTDSIYVCYDEHDRVLKAYARRW